MIKNKILLFLFGVSLVLVSYIIMTIIFKEFLFTWELTTPNNILFFTSEQTKTYTELSIIDSPMPINEIMNKPSRETLGTILLVAIIIVVIVFDIPI